ncbi:MAG: pitrilysin family protein, partial [Pseudomonadota bacterium]
GSTKSIEAMTNEQVQNYYNNNFVPENLIVTAAGAVDHDQFVESVKKHLQKKTWNQKFQKSELVTPPVNRVREHFQKDCEQFHIIVGFPACSYSDLDRFNGFVVNTAMGGGMTSKLYQSVREERGLVYSIFSMLNTFTDTGIQTIYAGTEKKHVPEVVELIHKELENLKANGLSKEEIDIFKTQAKGQIIIGAEDIDNRMNSIAVNEMIFSDYRPVDQVVADIDQVNQDSVMEYIHKHLDPNELSLMTLGSEDLNLQI